MPLLLVRTMQLWNTRPKGHCWSVHVDARALAASWGWWPEKRQCRPLSVITCFLLLQGKMISVHLAMLHSSQSLAGLRRHPCLCDGAPRLEHRCKLLLCVPLNSGLAKWCIQHASRGLLQFSSAVLVLVCYEYFVKIPLGPEM